MEYTLLFFWLGLSLAVAMLADKRGRSGVGWFFLALMFSPLLCGLWVLCMRDLSGVKSYATSGWSGRKQKPKELDYMPPRAIKPARDADPLGLASKRE